MVIMRMITLKDIDDDDGDDNGDDGGGVRQYISTRNIRQAKTYSGLIKQFGGRRMRRMRRMMMRMLRVMRECNPLIELPNAIPWKFFPLPPT